MNDSITINPNLMYDLKHGWVWIEYDETKYSEDWEVVKEAIDTMIENYEKIGKMRYQR